MKNEKCRMSNRSSECSLRALALVAASLAIGCHTQSAGGDGDGTESGTDGTGDGEAVCGDGVVEGGEECDDANEDETDACVSCMAATCGDGFVQSVTEECDDANEDDTDACVACRLATCGDGVVELGVEECDDANDVSTDACIDCVAAACGDGILQEGVEDCEDGNVVDADGCEADCTLPACGNQIVDPGELCHTGGVQVYAADVELPDAPPCMVLVDMDDDGNLDLLVVTIVENVPDGIVLLGNGDGTFEEEGLFPLQADPRWIRALDVNDDDFVDIVAATSDEVWVYVNDGTFDFMETQVPHNFGLVHAGAVGTFDGQPGLDLAVIAQGAFTPYRNVPFDPPFQMASFVAVAGPDSAFRGATVIDADEDGHPDVVFTGPTGTTVMGGVGDGTFMKVGNVDNQGTRADIVAMDATGDDVLDLVVSDPTQSLIAVLSGDGQGGFGAALTFATVDPQPRAMAMGDLDADGDTDVAVTHAAAGTVGIHLSDAGTLDESAQLWFGNGPLSISAGDVNNDTVPDLVVGTAEFGVMVSVSNP